MNVGQCFIYFPRSINMSAKIIPEGQSVNLLVTLFEVSAQVMKLLSDKRTRAMQYPNVLESFLQHCTNTKSFKSLPGNLLFGLVQVKNLSLKIKGLDQFRTLTSHITTHPVLAKKSSAI